MTDRRNPYLILGLDFGASAGEAASAFARVSRRLRQSADATYTIEDATWALHQVEQATSDHRSDVQFYRVPADPGVFHADAPDPEPQPATRTTISDPEAMAELRAQATASLLAPLMERLANSGLRLAYLVSNDRPAANE